MANILDTSNYGVCLFSLPVLQDFMKQNGINGNKLIPKLQRNRKLFIESQKAGIWVPIVGIDSVAYDVRLEGQDEPFGKEWDEKISYEGFNLEIQDTICMADIGLLHPFEVADFSGDEKHYETREGHTIYQQFQRKVPSGKYVLSIKGYSRKDSKGYGESGCKAEFGYWFSLKKVDVFEGYQNPREDELFDFNIGNRIRFKEAVICFYDKSQGGLWKLPSLKKNYCPAIREEGKRTCSLLVKFDKIQPFDNPRELHCRASWLLHFSDSAMTLESGKEYVISKEKYSYRTGKYTYKDVGKIVMK